MTRAAVVFGVFGERSAWRQWSGTSEIVRLGVARSKSLVVIVGKRKALAIAVL